jgi:hypothetical protein
VVLIVGEAGVGSAESWYVACDTTSKLVRVTANVNDATDRVEAFAG